MNSVVEKLAAIEKEVATIQPKMAPLTERIADLHQKVTDFTQQLADLAVESVAVKQDVELTRQCLSKIQSLISESKVESEQLVAGQEENLQRCETMTAVFGAAFQAVSQFFETAQRMGLADQAKAVFLPPVSVTNTLPLPVKIPLPTPPETMDEPTPEAVLHETIASAVQELFTAKMPDETVPTGQSVMASNIDTTVSEALTDEPVLSDADFDAVTPSADTPILDSLPVPNLPDVAAPPEMEHVDFDIVDSDTVTDSFADRELPQEIESHLDIPPLNLAVPSLPEQTAPETDNTDDQDIEDMLASMMTPVTAAAGN